MKERKPSYAEVVRLTRAGGYSQREIAASAHCSPSTVSDIQKRIRQSGVSFDDLADLSERELRGLLCDKPGHKADESYGAIDHAAIQEQLDAHKGLTLMIVWEEYAKACADAGKPAYMYSYFAEKHREWQGAQDITLRIPHAPGDRTEVDWAGTTMEWVDQYTGEIHDVYLFVACLPFSQYTFVKPTESMKTDDWIECNVAALRFFGGAPRIVVIDNLKTGVIANTPDEIVLNRTYQEFGEHYNLAIMPAGVKKPKMKASVEGNVGKIGERIALMLRNRRFFSLAEIEDAIEEKLDDLNSRPFNKRSDGSRRDVFLAKEKAMLSPLPAEDFEPGRWLRRTVSPDYRISVDASAYSVPYAFAGQTVDVRVGSKAVEVFCDGERIATHLRANCRGADVVQPSHRPKWHTEYLERSGERFRQRALDEIGPWGHRVAESILSAGKVEEEGYRSCASLLYLADRHGKRVVEDACERACAIARRPSLKTVKMLIKSRSESQERRDAKADYAILRDPDDAEDAGNAGKGALL